MAPKAKAALGIHKYFVKKQHGNDTNVELNALETPCEVAVESEVAKVVISKKRHPKNFRMKSHPKFAGLAHHRMHRLQIFLKQALQPNLRLSCHQRSVPGLGRNSRGHCQTHRKKASMTGPRRGRMERTAKRNVQLMLPGCSSTTSIIKKGGLGNGWQQTGSGQLLSQNRRRTPNAQTRAGRNGCG